MQVRKEYTRAAVDHILDHAARRHLQPHRFGIDGAADFQQLFGETQQVLLRQAAIAIGDRLHQRIGNPGPSAQHRILRDAELFRQLIRGPEADAAYIVGEAIGIFLHQGNGVGAIGLVDAHRPRRADAMALQEHHDFADRLLIGPAGGDAVEPDLANAAHLKQPMRRRFDDVEHCLAERRYEPLGEMRPNAFDQPRSQIALDALARGRRCHLQELGAELRPVLAMLLPMAARLDVLAGMDLGRTTKHSDEIALAAHLDAQHAKAGLATMEGDALNEPR